LEFEVLVFVEGGKPENLEKNPHSKATNKKLNPHRALGQNQTWVTLVGGECSHHCAIPPPWVSKEQTFKSKYEANLECSLKGSEDSNFTPIFHDWILGKFIFSGMSNKVPVTFFLRSSVLEADD